MTATSASSNAEDPQDATSGQYAAKGQSKVRATGSWNHQEIRASGSSFHVVTAGDNPDQHTVALLHPFPMYWWAWRHQIEALANAGYRVVAPDLRGFGGSDLTPGEVDLLQLAGDVGGVLRATGTGDFTVVGEGLGGSIAWMLAHMNNPGLKSVVTVCSPHPLVRLPRNAKGAIAAGRVERELTYSPFKVRRLQSGALVSQTLNTWCSPSSIEHMKKVTPAYVAPMSRVFAAASALETLKGARRLSQSGKKILGTPIGVPVWSIAAAEDARVPISAYAEDSRGAQSPVVHLEVEGSGHFPSEEAPQRLTEILLRHLSQTV